MIRVAVGAVSNSLGLSSTGLVSSDRTTIRGEFEGMTIGFFWEKVTSCHGGSLGGKDGNSKSWHI